MGSSSSKAAKVAGAVRRQYPQRIPPQNTNASSAPRPPAGEPSAPGPTVHPQVQVSSTRDNSINRDAADPDFARSLRSIGPVTPSPTISNSSTFNSSQSSAQQQQQYPSFNPQSSFPNQYPSPATNPALQVLTARSALTEEAEAEFAQTGKKGQDQGRRFLDVVLIRQVLMLRDDRGVGEEEIERRLGLRKGVVGRLGPKGVVGDIVMGGL